MLPKCSRLELSTSLSNFATPPSIYTTVHSRNRDPTFLPLPSPSSSELVQYTHKRVSGINDLERRLNLGYPIGSRVLDLMAWRAERASKAPKREIRFLPALMSVHTQVWRAVLAGL
ncbi:hypothetical protein C8F04DRAFT_1398510 [Mycena alexandri]|uniref:Uncharacterized protein n=1 Tax=Mycena alexandri TaxID=1745969 RepID=A0AAD6SJM7_9AGAR|nr:hypothetical protein C8F04DRAFT_1398510 [Mycena alexandri]